MPFRFCLLAAAGIIAAATSVSSSTALISTHAPYQNTSLSTRTSSTSTLTSTLVFSATLDDDSQPTTTAEADSELLPETPEAPTSASSDPAALTATEIVSGSSSSSTLVTVLRPAGPATSSKAIEAPSSPSSICSLPNGPLTVEQQVGKSTWGSLCQGTFPKWLDDAEGKPYTSPPWGNATTKTADASVVHDVPITNVTRFYNLTISRDQISADGVLRDVILVNGGFPGPVIEANWGDWIHVTVFNNISDPVEGTSIHWHGMLQRDSPWYDGVPSVSQCPIAPGHTFTYHFQAQIFGTTWYHAHYSAQYTAGVMGPVIVHGPTSADYDIDVGPVMLSDWNHIPFFSMVSDVVGTNMSLIPPASDGILINGRGQFNCSKPSYDSGKDWLASNLKSNLTWTCIGAAQLSKFMFQPGKTHRLRLLNHGANGVQKFSIDGHKMTVIATDFVPNIPYETNVVTLGVGQRTDVLVKADNFTTQIFWMRAELPGGVPCGGSKNPVTLAALYYEGADTFGLPATSSGPIDTSCANEPLNTTQPDYSITPSKNPYVSDIVLSLALNKTGAFEFRMNKQTFRANFNHPSLFLAAEGNTSYPYDPQWNVYDFGENKSIVLNVTNRTPLTHPFHLHGFNFYVLDEGPRGTVWNGSIVNPANPMRRDTQIIQAGGYAALMFEAENPGMWSFHCHIAWHLSAGQGMNILTRPRDIPTIPDGMRDQTCAAWWDYTNQHVVDQIDSGT